MGETNTGKGTQTLQNSQALKSLAGPLGMVPITGNSGPYVHMRVIKLVKTEAKTVDCQLLLQVFKVIWIASLENRVGITALSLVGVTVLSSNSQSVVSGPAASASTGTWQKSKFYHLTYWIKNSRSGLSILCLLSPQCWFLRSLKLKTTELEI